MKILQKIVITLLLLTLGFSLFAAIEFPTEVSNSSNDVLSSIFPILYGDDSFRSRILERTKGERDPIALVLSGGSARAFAHIGVLKYLEEQGIVPDLIISNSMGSMVGILYAAGFSPDQIYEIISQLDISKLFDFTMPISGGLLDTSRFTSLVASYLGKEVRLEELPLPIMVISEDLATKRQVRIMEGDILPILEAAFALPVYFSPVLFNGHLLIDGGVANIVPLEVAYNYSDTVIVSTTFYEGKGLNLRNTLTILNTSLDIAKRRLGVLAMEAHRDAIWVRCDVEDYSFMDFKAIEELTHRGYSSAAKQQAELSQLESGVLGGRVEEVRSGFRERQARLLSDYRLFDQVDQQRLSHLVYLGLAADSYQHGASFFRQESLLGLFYTLRWRGLTLTVQGGGGWESISPMRIYPNLTTTLTYQIIPQILFEGDLNVAFDRASWPTIHSRLALLGRMSFLDEQLVATLQVSWENQMIHSVEFEKMLLHTGVALEWKPKGSANLSLLGEGAWQVGGNWDRHFIHTKVRGYLPIPYGFSFEALYTGRYALDGGGHVPLFQSDGFRSSSLSLDSPANFLIVGSFGLDWQPPTFKPTAGELLIFENSSIGFYSDLLFNDSDERRVHFVYGGRVKTTISFLGLKSLPTTLYIGWDKPRETLYWGFILGAEF